MKRRHMIACLVAMAVTLGLVLRPAPAAASPLLTLPPVDVIGLTAAGTGLATISTSATATPTSSKAITGLQPGEVILGIDVRPTTGRLYGLGSTSRLYTIDTITGQAAAVGPSFTPALSGNSFGFDFNPVVDRIRVTSDLGQNLRLNPDTGGIAAVDSNLNGATSSIVASAYTNSAGIATSTTLYGINHTTTSLYIQNPPNAGTQTLVGGLGASMPLIGFDIFFTGTSNHGIASMILNGVAGLYEINLATGAATFIGATEPLMGIAVAGPAGYCGADFDGEVSCAGGAGGARPSIPGLADEIVDAVQTPSGQGVWQVAFDGGVFASGDADFFGSAGGLPLAQPVVGMASRPNGRGYWLVASDGGVFAYGDAPFLGSVPGVLAPGQSLNQAVVGIVGTGTGAGYWLVAEDGGIFAFGDAAFFGSVPGVLSPGEELVSPVIGIARNESGAGYYMVAIDGGVFAFGAPFLGSAGGLPLVAPVLDIAAAGPGGGYRLFAADGGIFNYGPASFRGSIQGMDFGVGLAG